MTDDELDSIIGKHLDTFYARRILKLSTLQLDKTLKRKNPYLFRAIGTQDAAEIVDGILRAFMSSSDEGIFGDAFFEPLVHDVSRGSVSPSEGVDVAVVSDARYLAVAVKSGPSVFNAQSRGRQNQNFSALRSRMLKTQKHFEALVGYCYGTRSGMPTDKWIFQELSGQSFWAEITGEEDFYLKIIRAMKEKPAEHKVAFDAEWNRAKNRFVQEFTQKYCDDFGNIDWEKITRMNSGARPARTKKTGG